MRERNCGLIDTDSMKYYYSLLKECYKKNEIYFYPSGTDSRDGVIEVWEDNTPIFLDNIFQAMMKLEEKTKEHRKNTQSTTSK